MIVEADLTWTGERFERGIRIAIEDGRITDVGALGAEGKRLERRAILPGFVSAHSHAFQRALRGRGETFPEGAGSFWSWREAMYALVQQLDADRFYDAIRATFEEMLAAGITTVGEFHYLHHAPAGNDWAFDELVLRAARDAGIRIVLLLTYYKTGAIGRPLALAQQRFSTQSLDDFWCQVDRLGAMLDARTQTLGVAAHSIRGVPLEEIAPLYAEARRRGMVVHMHVEEQRKEIDDCRAAYGATPLHLINTRLPSCEGFTAVHATHSEPEEMRRFLGRGGQVCITPLTEANLGDGIPDVSALRAPSLGTDSNARVSMLEEMRWLEYAQRLRSETRGVFRGARPLLDAATINGARSLGIDAGRIGKGALADLVIIDLDARSIKDVDEEHLLEALIFGAGDGVIEGTIVAHGANRKP
ncbi:MAG TPA: formimidoylglutamate deiminase [Thermoanaerobaculia bacterium]|nr:formimidoylglutamate deiminase [Thermoanaerobaculia bacterium]